MDCPVQRSAKLRLMSGPDERRGAGETVADGALADVTMANPHTSIGRLRPREQTVNSDASGRSSALFDDDSERSQRLALREDIETPPIGRANHAKPQRA